MSRVSNYPGERNQLRTIDIRNDISRTTVDDIRGETLGIVSPTWQIEPFGSRNQIEAPMPHSKTRESEPNKALEPTPTAVTDPAAAGSAPAMGVAHL